jgi:hypothetical protein
MMSHHNAWLYITHMVMTHAHHGIVLNQSRPILLTFCVPRIDDQHYFPEQQKPNAIYALCMKPTRRVHGH